MFSDGYAGTREKMGYDRSTDWADRVEWARQRPEMEFEELVKVIMQNFHLKQPYSRQIAAAARPSTRGKRRR
jgi:hypothetical protein